MLLKFSVIIGSSRIWVTVGSHDLMERRSKVGIRASIHDDRVHGSVGGAVNADDGADSQGRLGRGPKMELMWAGGQRFGRDDPAHGPAIFEVDHHQLPSWARKYASTC